MYNGILFASISILSHDFHQTTTPTSPAFDIHILETAIVLDGEPDDRRDLVNYID